MSLLRIILALIFLAAGSCQLSCLNGTHHKGAPSPEPDMQECVLYSTSSCCHANLTKKFTPSPIIKVDNYYWNRCGNLSKTCENYMKKIECFYQCSPIAAHWVHPNISAAIQNVPLCQSFCDNWFAACRSDLTCVHNFLSDWTIDESGNHCKNECIPYDQMYVNGTDLCESAWGTSFVVSHSPCRCLDMTQTDGNVVKFILENELSAESREEQACKLRQPGPQDKGKPDEDEDDGVQDQTG